jgi:hypothetical protein
LDDHEPNVSAALPVGIRPLQFVSVPRETGADLMRAILLQNGILL